MQDSFRILPIGKTCLCDHARMDTFFFKMYLKGNCLCNRAVSRKLFKAIMGREARVITKTKELVPLKEVSV